VPFRSSDRGVIRPATRNSTGIKSIANGPPTASRTACVTGDSVTSRCSEYAHQSISPYPATACPTMIAAISRTFRLST
jgi:hypothetical protein